ncbi:hypothetical protein JKG47_12150 [Acidithiobacillus sp. MC6.1]|nr:hypothetical protein [Acidithiobacillus sp. MC6.1]
MQPSAGVQPPLPFCAIKDFNAWMVSGLGRYPVRVKSMMSNLLWVYYRGDADFLAKALTNTATIWYQRVA